MSIFQRMLASVGIGSAKADTLLEKNRYYAGEQVKGVVKIYGGHVEQNVDSIYLSVFTQYLKEVNDNKVRQNAEIVRYLVSQPFQLKPGENRELPFSFPLPEFTPLTTGGTPVWIKTGLDIKNAVDPTDEDNIVVTASPDMQVVFDAIQHLGFRLRSATCEYSRINRNLPFVQEFEFVPTTHFRGHLDELEAVFFPREHELEVLLQIDRRARGLASLFAEALDMDESFVRVTFKRQDLAGGPEYVAQQLSSIISKYI